MVLPLADMSSKNVSFFLTASRPYYIFIFYLDFFFFHRIHAYLVSFLKTFNLLRRYPPPARPYVSYNTRPPKKLQVFLKDILQIKWCGVKFPFVLLVTLFYCALFCFLSYIALAIKLFFANSFTVFNK